MKTLEFDLGGRPLANDDLVTLQAETTASVAALYSGKGAFIVAGCQVSGSGPAYNVAAGIIFIDGQLLRFYGAGGVTLPAQLQRGGYDLLDQRTYQVGGTKTCIRERVAVLAAADSTYRGGEFIPFDSWGGKRWEHVLRDTMRNLAEVQQVANLNTTHYDATGLGLPGTEAWGWGLCNGEGGRADLRGMSVVGYNPDRGNDGRGNNITVNSIGDGGGKEAIMLTQANLPPNPPGTGDVATFTGNGNSNLTQSGSNGWNGQQPRAGTSAPVDARPPFYVLGMRQWVGY
jgi:hypothetical protein